MMTLWKLPDIALLRRSNDAHLSISGHLLGMILISLPTSVPGFLGRFLSRILFFRFFVKILQNRFLCRNFMRYNEYVLDQEE